jgi:hypothetical protein
MTPARRPTAMMTTKNAATVFLICLALVVGGIVAHLEPLAWVVPVVVGGVIGTICLFIVLIDVFSGSVKHD